MMMNLCSHTKVHVYMYTICIRRADTAVGYYVRQEQMSMTWQNEVQIMSILYPLTFNSYYCDLRGRIKGTARALYPVFVERALWPILSGHKAR